MTGQPSTWRTRRRVSIDAKLHQQVKMRAVAEDRLMQEVVDDLIRLALALDDSVFLPSEKSPSQKPPTEDPPCTPPSQRLE